MVPVPFNVPLLPSLTAVCVIGSWRETISHISFAWCQKTNGLEQALAQAHLHQTSTVKHLTHYANVTLGPSILAESPEILLRTLFLQLLFQRTCYSEEKN